MVLYIMYFYANEIMELICAVSKAAEISSYAMTKLNNDRPVSMEAMINLCKVFHCDIGDLMEVIEED